LESANNNMEFGCTKRGTEEGEVMIVDSCDEEACA